MTKLDMTSHLRVKGLVDSKFLSDFANRFGVELIILFGSATDPQRKPSDVDLAVLLPEKKRVSYDTDILRYTDFWMALGSALGTNPDRLDITFLSPKTPPLLLYYIARNGRLLYGDRRRFSLFRIKAMRTFFDTEPLRRAQDIYLKRVIYAR